MPQTLASKERNLFGQVVKLYEGKQYKKGLKAAEQILRKVPNHADTLAMKALILNAQGHAEEAFALGKVALTHDMKSHICWHVYGLLYRSAKNFEEAIKAYKFALRLEPESQQIQRDLALLQMQMRDYPGYVQSRRAMLTARPGMRQNWTALAIAQHLSGDLPDAERTLTTYEETLRQPPPKTDIEHAETVLYKNHVIAEMGETERALEHLEAVSKHNFDKQTVMELRAKYLLQLDRKEEAAKAYRALLDRNAENRVYYDGLQAALNIETADTKSLQEMYAPYAAKSARADAARRIPLDFLTGEEFRTAADDYLQRMLAKGVPSTFANIKALYADATKRDMIQELVEGYGAGKRSTLTNGSSEKKGDEKTFETAVLYFLAQHYNYHLSRNLDKAMENIERAIVLAPDFLDYPMTKARILKHQGNTQSASAVMEQARAMDEKDRYINTKAAKYQLRNNEHEAAVATMGKFTRKEAVGGPLGDLLDMQCVWFITEDGESYLRQRDIGRALKRFHAVYNIFEVWQEDQFDFHSFSLRKGQIRAYVNLVRWEDHLRDHPFFTRAAIAAAKTYVMLADKPDLAHGQVNGVNGTGKLDAAEQKKAARKAKKQQEKQDQIDAEKKDAKKTAGTVVDGEVKKEDTDPHGKALLQTSEPLQEAMKFLSPALEFSPKNFEVQKMGFEVFLRRDKYLLAAKCLLAMQAIDASHPAVHYASVRLQNQISKLVAPLPSGVNDLLNSLLEPLRPKGKQDLKSHNNAYLDANKDSARQNIAALQARVFLDPSTKTASATALTGLISHDSMTPGDAAEAVETLQDWNESTADFTAKAHARWPDVTRFAAAK